MKYANTIINYIDNVQGLDEATKNAYLGRALSPRISLLHAGISIWRCSLDYKDSQCT